MNDSDTVLRALRDMAWERAKGELQSILASYYSNGIPMEKIEFARVCSLVENFIKKMDGEI